MYDVPVAPLIGVNVPVALGDDCHWNPSPVYPETDKVVDEPEQIADGLAVIVPETAFGVTKIT